MLLGNRSSGNSRMSAGKSGKEGLKASYYTRANVLMLKLIILHYVVKMRSGTSCLVKSLAVWALRRCSIFGSVLSELNSAICKLRKLLRPQVHSPTNQRKEDRVKYTFAFCTSAKRPYCQPQGRQACAISGLKPNDRIFPRQLILTNIKIHVVLKFKGREFSSVEIFPRS